MGGDDRLAELPRRKLFGDGRAERPFPEAESPAESGEASCRAFTFLRGLTDRAIALELRYRSGDRDFYEYSCLQSGRFNRSVGMLLKFSGGDVTTLVLILGSNLDMPVQPGPVTLPEGVRRHRVVRVREMDEDELRLAGRNEPTTDRILVGEFESVEEQRKWLQKVAPVFVR